MKELECIYYSQVSINNLVLPLKIDIALLRDDTTSELKYVNMKKSDDKVIIDNTYKYYEEEYRNVQNENDARFYFGFFDTTNKLFDGKNLKEFLNTDDLFIFFKSRGMDMIMLNTIKREIMFNIENCLNMYRGMVEKLLELKNEKQMYYNETMTILQVPYERLHLPYFKENINKAYSEFSLREKILSLCYFSKVNMINNAIEKEKSKIMNEGKSSNRKPSRSR